MKKRSFSACCPNCKGALELESSWIGHKGQCPYCGFKFIIEKSKCKSVRSMLMSGLCILMLGLVGFGYVSLKATKKNEVAEGDLLTNTEHRTPFQKSKDKLVLIDCEDGSGSGFLAEMSGKKYLITNEHVLRLAKGDVPRARLLDGRDIQLGELEIARDRDLVRIAVDSEVEPFKVKEETPDIGAEVIIYGNSAGGGVVTEVTGRIQGVGPSRIEVDAMFVSGNSGSPVIDTNANVIGVATYATYNSDKKDWTKKDTRFNDVRRYALRLSSIEWESVEWNKYKDCVVTAHDVGYAWVRLRPYLYAFYRDVDASYLGYDEGCKRDYLSDSENESIHRALMDVAENYEALNDAKDDYGKLTGNRDEFIKALRGEVDDREKRLYLIDDYDSEVLKKQVALIEYLFLFNESKAKAIAILDNRIKDDCGISLVENGDGELDKGLRGLCKEINILKGDLQRCIDKYGNASGFAVNLIEGTGRLARKDVRLGTLLLHDISCADQDARKRLLDLWKNDKLDKTVEDEEFGRALREWMCTEYENGDKWFGLIAGNVAYEKGNYDKAVKCWTDAKSTNTWALLRLGCFYYRSQDCGGAPIEMRSDEKAKQCFEEIVNNGGALARSRDKIKNEAKYWLGHLLLFSDDKACFDNTAALEIFKQLYDMDSENLSYMFCLGLAQQLGIADESFNLMLTYLSYIDMWGKYYSAIDKVGKSGYDDWKRRGGRSVYNYATSHYRIARDAETFCEKFIDRSRSKFVEMYAERRNAVSMINKAHAGGCAVAEEYLRRYPINEETELLYAAKYFADLIESKCKQRTDMEKVKKYAVDSIMSVVRQDYTLRRIAINKLEALKESGELSALEQGLLNALTDE